MLSHFRLSLSPWGRERKMLIKRAQGSLLYLKAPPAICAHTWIEKTGPPYFRVGTFFFALTTDRNNSDGAYIYVCVDVLIGDAGQSDGDIGEITAAKLQG